MADNRQSFKDIYNQLQKINGVLCNSATTGADYDTILLCDPVSGNIVIAVVTITLGVPSTVYYNPDATPYVGPPPIRCQDSVLESDDHEICVAGVSLIRHIVKDNGVPTGTIYFTNLLGVLVPPPPLFTIGTCPDAGPQVFNRVLCDDVNGDGSLILNYIQFYEYDPNTNTITITGNWDQTLAVPYIPVNPISCNNTGNNIVQRAVELIGIGSFTRPANFIHSITVMVRQVGDVTMRPTITDHIGTVISLFEKDSLSWGVPSKGADLNWLTGNFTVNSNPNDYILIIWTEFV